MKVCVCDRCGRQFSPTEINGEFVNRVIDVSETTFSLTEPEGTVYESYDICDSCYDSFKRWFKRWVIESRNENAN